jgi:hypothetical protein
MSPCDPPGHPAQTTPVASLILAQLGSYFVKRYPRLKSSNRLKRGRLFGAENVSNLKSIFLPNHEKFHRFMECRHLAAYF